MMELVIRYFGTRPTSTTRKGNLTAGFLAVGILTVYNLPLLLSSESLSTGLMFSG